MTNGRVDEPILVLTETMLRDLLMCEGITSQNARSLSRRICMALPDLGSLTQRVETRVVEQVLASIEEDVADGVMAKLCQIKVRRADKIFEPVDAGLAARIEQRAADLMNEEVTEKEQLPFFMRSLMRSNRPHSETGTGNVLILTSEMRGER